MIWAGNEKGFISSSLASDSMIPFIGYPAHQGSVQDLLIHKELVLSIGGNSVRGHNRRGLQKLHLKHVVFLLMLVFKMNPRVYLSVLLLMKFMLEERIYTR